MVKTRPGCGSCVVSCCICVSHVSPGLVRVLQALVSAALLHDKDDFILLDIPQLCRPWNILELSSTCRFSKINSKINRIEAKTRCQTVRSSSPGSFRTKNFAWRAAFRTAFRSALASTFVQTCKGRVKTSCVACAAATTKATIQQQLLHLFGCMRMMNMMNMMYMMYIMCIYICVCIYTILK